jgi:hypothetical protein
MIMNLICHVPMIANGKHLVYETLVFFCSALITYRKLYLVDNHISANNWPPCRNQGASSARVLWRNCVVVSLLAKARWKPWRFSKQESSQVEVGGSDKKKAGRSA